MVGPGVAEQHAAGVQGHLEHDSAAAAEAAGEDGAVVGEHAGGISVLGDEGPVAGVDGRGGEPPGGGAGRAVAGVVVEPVADLGIGAVGQRPVGDVGLPPFVGLGGLEPDVAALGALVRLRGDEAAGGEDPPDGGDRRAGAVPAGQLGGDGGRAGLVLVPVEVLADCDDLVLERVGGPGRAPQRPSGAGLQTRLALGQVALDQGDHPAAGDAVVPGHLTSAPTLDQHRGDHQLRHPHRPPPGSGVNDVPRQVCTMS